MKNLIPSILCISLLGCAPIHRHPTATKVIAVGIGITAGVIIAKRVNNPHCNHYPPGYNGVGVNCPNPD